MACTEDGCESFPTPVLGMIRTERPQWGWGPQRLRCRVVFFRLDFPAHFHFAYLPALQQHQIQEPCLVHLPEVEFLGRR